MQEHVKAMTKISEGLSVIGDPISKEDRLVHLLASLPDPNNMLVTVFEANMEVPKFEVVTERLLHEERKLKEQEVVGARSDRAMTVQQRSKTKGLKCHHCENSVISGGTAKNGSRPSQKPEGNQKHHSQPGGQKQAEGK